MSPCGILGCQWYLAKTLDEISLVNVTESTGTIDGHRTIVSIRSPNHSRGCNSISLSNVM